MRTERILLVVVSSALLALLSGCPSTGIVCRGTTARCGTGCADYTTDRRNCGGCGQACGTGQICQDSACICQEGSTLCNGTCVVVQHDALNCGMCGQACASTEVCEAGQCKASCTAGVSLRCGTSCVDAMNDPTNCGACGNACQSGQTCRTGSCVFDVVAACFSTGQLRGFHSASFTQGPPADLGSGPASLARVDDVVLALDGIDRRMYQARVPAGESAYWQLNWSNVTGSSPNQALVDTDYVYVINSESGTLQVLSRSDGARGTDVIVVDGGPLGLPLRTVAALSFGMNTYPEGMVKLGTDLWVPLYGGFGESAAAAGQRIVKVSIADPLNPVQTDTIDLSGLDFKAFDGGAIAPRPWSISERGGFLYVVLNNLEPNTYAPAGPGMIAKINPADKSVVLIDLGAAACLNPQAAAALGSGWVVSCGGEVIYAPPTYAVVETRSAGLVLLNAGDQPVASWAPVCPSGSALSDGGTSCPPFLPGRVAVDGNRVFLADQNAGRVLAFDVIDGGIVERRGLAPSTGGPIQACALTSTGVSNVSDLLIVK